MRNCSWFPATAGVALFLLSSPSMKLCANPVYFGPGATANTPSFRVVRNTRFSASGVESRTRSDVLTRLGHSLATLDWNRDGREDFAVSNLDSAAALLIGETSPTGNYIKIQLRAVDSARDAIGADVVVESANHRCVHQLVCGDGYQTSNERTIVVGLGMDTLVKQITIRWPSGRQQTLKSFSVNQQILIVEGREPIRI